MAIEALSAAKLHLLAGLATQARLLLATAVADDNEGIQTTEDLRLRIDQNLALAVTEYNAAEVKTRELVTRFNTAFWAWFNAGESGNYPIIEVPDCEWSEERINESMIGFKKEESPGLMLYIPPGFDGPEGFIRLGDRFPELDNNPELNHFGLQEGTTIRNDPEKEIVLHDGRYIKIEASSVTPNLGATEYETRQVFADHNRTGLTAAIYLIGAKAIKALTGFYPDVDTASQILNSTDSGQQFYAFLNNNGDYCTNKGLSPGQFSPFVGTRSAEYLA